MKDPGTVIAGGSAALGLAAALVVDSNTVVIGGLTVAVLFAVVAGAAAAESFGRAQDLGDAPDAWARARAAGWAILRVAGSTVIGGLFAPAAIKATDSIVAGDADHVIVGVLSGLLGVLLLRKLFRGVEHAADEWMSAIRERVTGWLRGGPKS